MMTQYGPIRSVAQMEDPEEDVSEQPEDETQVIEVTGERPPDRVRRPRRGLLKRMFARAGFGVWFGLVLTAGGFGLIAFTWSQVAALTDVAQQVPYLVSGGLV